MYDNTVMDITGTTCIDPDGVCGDNDTIRQWTTKIAGGLTTGNYRMWIFQYDGVQNAAGG